MQAPRAAAALHPERPEEGKGGAEVAVLTPSSPQPLCCADRAVVRLSGSLRTATLLGLLQQSPGNHLAARSLTLALRTAVAGEYPHVNCHPALQPASSASGWFEVRPPTCG